MRISRLFLVKRRNRGVKAIAPLIFFLSRLQKQLWFFLLGSGIVFSFLAVHFGYTQEWGQWIHHHWVDYTERFGYRLEDIYIQGRHFTRTSDILHTINMKRADSAFKHSPQAIKENLETLPWIEKAVVRRQLPGLLHVHIVERTPIAIWQHQHLYHYVDQKGVVIHSSLQPVFQHLPVVVGLDAPQHMPRLMNLLKNYPEILSKIKAIVRVNKRRWDLVLHKNIIIKLPELQIEAAVARLNLLLEGRRINWEEVTAIDLRLPKQLIAKVSPSTIIRLKLKVSQA